MIGCNHPSMKFWLPSDAERIATGSLPYPENERQRNVNNFWFCIMGNLTGNRFQSSIGQVLATFRGKNNSNVLPAPS